MIFPPDVAIDLHPTRAWHVPYTEILRAWMRASFEPVACAQILREVVERDELDPALLDLDAPLHGGPTLTPHAMFGAPPAGRDLLIQRFPDGRDRPAAFGYLMELSDTDAEAAADFVRDGAASCDARGFWHDQADLGDELAGHLAGAIDPGPRWRTADRPGIYRREHASLLIRSREASVVIDPLSTLVRFPHLEHVPADNGYDRVDAVLITHIHGDHWHVPSLLKAAGHRETPVIVPRVPRLNVLTRFDMAEELRLLRQRVVAPAWGTTLRFADLEIEVLPFYGEQPTRDGPGPDPAVRNWGNCFRFDTPDFSAIVLADAGADPQGTMRDVIAASVARRGPVDVVLSCLREFPAPFFDAQEDYWGPVPFSQLAALYAQHRAGQLPSTTSGPEGAAQLCEAAGARFFLPYAHGFRSLGAPIDHIGWGHGHETSEAARLGELAARLPRCEALPWCAGDAAQFARGALTMVAHRR